MIFKNYFLLFKGYLTKIMHTEKIGTRSWKALKIPRSQPPRPHLGDEGGGAASG